MAQAFEWFFVGSGDERSLPKPAQAAHLGANYMIGVVFSPALEVACLRTGTQAKAGPQSSEAVLT